ncbi:MAG: hypothetical protein JO247_21270 [Chloroflexi bacterium]|nr:hypothetical protein [Chloroflexota bacterium]
MAAPSSASAVWQGVLTVANQEEVAQRIGDLLRDRYYIMAIDTEGYSQIQLEQLLSMESLTSRSGEIEFRDRLGAHTIQVTNPDDPYPWHHTYLRIYDNHMHVRCYKRDRDRVVDWTIALQERLPG